MINKIYSDLLDAHYNYYWSVYYEYIIEAIKNTIKDLKITSYKSNMIEAIHKNIIENYI